MAALLLDQIGARLRAQAACDAGLSVVPPSFFAYGRSTAVGGKYRLGVSFNTPTMASAHASTGSGADSGHAPPVALA